MSVDRLEPAAPPSGPLRPFSVRGVWREPVELPRGYHRDDCTLLEFAVAGVAEPQGSHRAISIGGKARLVEGANDAHKKRLNAWRDEVVIRAVEARDLAGLTEPLDEPVSLTVAFVMPRPASAPKRHIYARSAPDLDKLVRAIGDALEAANVVTNDGRIVEIHATKRLATEATSPGVVVSLQSLGTAEVTATQPGGPR